MQQQLKAITDFFDALSVVTAQLINKENRVAHLLASLPNSYNMLVTALEANADIAKIDVVKKRLLHKEQKPKKDRVGVSEIESKAIKQRLKKKVPKCHKL